MKRGFTCGAFDLFHAGHVLLMRDAKMHCDHLTVGLQTDPTIDRPSSKHKPVQSMYERYTQLKGCRYIDEIIPYDTEADLYNLLKTSNIDVRFLGSDYKYRPYTGLDLNIEVMFIDRLHNYSSTALVEKIRGEPWWKARDGA